MSTTPWEDFAKRSRELYEQQAELAKTWFDGQSQARGRLGRDRRRRGPDRPRCRCGGHGRAVALLAGARQLAGRRHARDAGRARADRRRDARPVPGSDVAALASGSQVGETIRKMTEGPRFADLGAIERRMGKVMQLWLQVQQAARAYEAVVGRCLARGQPALRQGVPEASRAGQAPAQPNEALKLWLDIANRTLLETHRSEPFLAAQGELLAPWHGLPAGRARDGRGAGRARGPADAHRDRRGPPLGPGAQAPGARAREGECAADRQRPAGPPVHNTQGRTRRREPGHDPDAHRRHGRADARGRHLQHQGRRRDHQAEHDQGRAGPDRDHAQGRGVHDRQGHPLPLPPAGRARRSRPRC